MNLAELYRATAADMSKLDRIAVEEGLEIRQMMELAGWHMLAAFQQLKVAHDATVYVVCGVGNKGGDGLAAARHLLNHGWDVNAILLRTEISRDALHHLELLKDMGAAVYEFDPVLLSDLESSDVIIDGLIGYNLSGAPRDIFAQAVGAINDSPARVIAYDVPTGFDANKGQALSPTIRAEATLILALLKEGLQSPNGKRHAGRLFLADIGIPDWMYDHIRTGSRPEFDVTGLMEIECMLSVATATVKASIYITARPAAALLLGTRMASSTARWTSYMLYLT